MIHYRDNVTYGTLDSHSEVLGSGSVMNGYRKEVGLKEALSRQLLSLTVMAVVTIVQWRPVETKY